MKNITIYGNCAKDAVVRTTQGGMDVCGFDIAVNDRRTKETYWFSVSYWGKAGKAVSPYLRKGQPVVVNGEFSWREYNDKKYLEVNANSVSLAGKATGNPHPTAETAGDLKPTYLGTEDDAFDDTIPF
jgi:single stranded DNA-binding protein